MRLVYRSFAALAALLLAAPTASASPTVLSRSPANPILDRGPSGTFDEVQVGPRVVLKESAGGTITYKMWYEGVPGGNRASVGYATSADGLVWTKRATPVMTPSEAWEGGPQGETSPEAILFENGTYKLWYHGYQNGIRRIGYATSPDGIVWTKFAGNPVVNVGTAGAWDATQASDPRVLRVGSGYVMFYIGGNIPPGTSQIYHIGRATSPDGASWAKDPQPVISATQAWESGSLGPLGVLYEDGGYKAWYAAGSPADDKMGYATSQDGISWTKFVGNPVLTKSGIAGTADELGVGDGVTVYRDGDVYRVMYGGFGGSPAHISVCLATATADVSDAGAGSGGSDAGAPPSSDASVPRDGDASTPPSSPDAASPTGSPDGSSPPNSGGCTVRAAARQHHHTLVAFTVLLAIACARRRAARHRRPAHSDHTE